MRKDYKNYRSYAKREVSVDNVPVVNSGLEEKEDVKQDILDQEIKKPIRKGKVTNCSMVNVRLTPSASAPITTIISAGELVNINMDKSTDEYYAVTTSYDIPGFINKDYIVLY